MADLNSFVQNKTKLKGEELRDFATELEKKHHPVFLSSQWIGCRPSVAHGRGFTCGLWQLFHYLTVEAANSNESPAPLEVLLTVYGYVKHYFGCAECSEHFLGMVDKNEMWKVNTTDGAVIWLWSAHNEVNDRLAGDITEDPMFPKIQYPSRHTCSPCSSDKKVLPVQGSTPTEDDRTPNWQSTEVLYYMRQVYARSNISWYKVDDDECLSSEHASHSNELF